MAIKNTGGRSGRSDDLPDDVPADNVEGADAAMEPADVADDAEAASADAAEATLPEPDQVSGDEPDQAGEDEPDQAGADETDLGAADAEGGAVLDLADAILGMEPEKPATRRRTRAQKAPAEVAEAESSAAEVADDVEDATANEAQPTVVEAEAAADEAADEAEEATKPVRQPVRKLTQAPVKKATATRKRDDTAQQSSSGRTTPFAFVRQSIGELRKVVWPSGDTVGQYFIVVLVFVLFIMALVWGLDTLFGWGLMRIFR